MSKLICLAALFAATAAGCSDEAGTGTGPITRTIRHEDHRAGLSAQVPPGWFVIDERISGVGYPRQVLAAASYPVKLSNAPSRGCHPGRVLSQMPQEGALLQLIEYTPSGLGNKYKGLLSRTPSRPAHFDFPYGSYGSYEWSGNSYQINFKDSGRIFSAQVWMDRARVDPEVRTQVLNLLDSLRFAPREPSEIGGRRTVKLPGSPVDAVSGAGSLWVLTRSTQHGVGQLVRIDLHSGRLASTTAIHGPQAIAFAWGSVWVVESRRNRIVRFDGQNGWRLATIGLRLQRPVSDKPDGSAFVPLDVAAGEGAVWVSTARGSIARIDPRSNRVADQIAIPFEAGATIAVGKGAIWPAGDLNGAIRIDARTQRKSVIPIRGAGGRRLSVGSLAVAGNKVWATGAWASPRTDATGHRDFGPGNGGALVALSPRGRVLRTRPLPAGMGIAPSSTDSVWLSMWRSGDVFVVRRSTGDAERALRLNYPGHLVAALRGALWIAGLDNRLVAYPVSGRLHQPGASAR